jgi:hypothetical protein
MKGRGERGRGDLLIIFMFGSKDGRGGERIDFNCKYVWFKKGVEE